MPKRVPEILAVTSAIAGSGSAVSPDANTSYGRRVSNFAISPDVVAETASDAPTVVPEFAPGDSLLFDERCVHRTHMTMGMTYARYAVECWMFAPSHHTPNYTPLLI